MVVLPLLGFRVVVNAKKGRKNEHHYYLATVVLLRKKPKKYGRVNVVVPLAKVVFVRRVLVVVFKNRLLVAVARVTTRVTVARVQRVFVNAPHPQLGVFRVCARRVPPRLLPLKQTGAVFAVNVHKPFKHYGTMYSFLRVRRAVVVVPLAPVGQVR